jgi:ParB family chromosome partitioning protein
MRRAIGKGLSQLVGEQFESNPAEAPIDAIVPNTRQPRTVFADEPLQELAASIRECGILQPLLVRPIGEGRYELIAGERRLRAAKIAGLESVPILIRPAGGQSSLELALIENVQREDINAMECARAYRRLIDEFDLTQEQVADRVGKSRSGITNTIRLLRLPKQIQDGLESGQITEGHARALLALDTTTQQLAVYDRILSKGLTVRDVESAARPTDKKPAPRKVVQRKTNRNPNFAAIEQRLSEHFGSPVSIGGGEVSIAYYSEEDLERILEVLGVSL